MYRVTIADCNISPSQNKNDPRNIYNYKKADLDKIKPESSEFTETFPKEYINKNVEKN